jgi:hypothetical protein
MTSTSSVVAHDPQHLCRNREDRLKHVEAADALIENGEGGRPELDNRLEGFSREDDHSLAFVFGTYGPLPSKV